MNVLKGVVGFVLTIVVAKMLGISWLAGIAIVGGLWLLSETSGGIGGAFSSVGAGIGRTFGFFQRLIVSLAVFLGLMMIFDRATGVAPAKVVAGFYVLGIRPWGWPANIGLPLILWTCVAFIAAGIASRAAAGSWQTAAKIFGVSAIVIFTTLYTRDFRAAIAPTTMTGADSALVQSGVVGVVGNGAATLLAGSPVDLEEHGFIGSSARRVWSWAFGKPKPKATTSTARATQPERTLVKLRTSRRTLTTPDSARIVWSNFEFDADENFWVWLPGVPDSTLITPESQGLPSGIRKGGMARFKATDLSRVSTVEIFEVTYERR